MISSKQENTIRLITGKLSPSFVGVFGSYARGDEDERSDLDLLIDTEQRVDLLTLIGIEQELSDALGLKVDLVTVRSLNPSIQHYIKKDLVRIL